MANRTVFFSLSPIFLPGSVFVSLLAAAILVCPSLPASAQSFEIAGRFGVGVQPQAAAIGDFNEDSKPDVVVANYGGNSLSVLLGNGSGGFGAGTLLSVGSFPIGVVAGDFNGDGHLDLAAANFGSNNVSVLLGNGNGTFGAPTSFSTGLGPAMVVTADFDADSRLDLAVANYNAGTVSILRGDGSGGFTPWASPATGAGPWGLAAGNLNGDTYPDLVVANLTGNTVSVLLGTGTPSFTIGTTVTGYNAPWSVALAPLNADGNADLIVVNSGSSASTVSVRFGNGDGTFGASSSYVTGKAPRWVLATDFNGDGKVDLAVGSYQANDVTVRLNDGTGGFATATLYGAGAAINGLGAADFDGDGTKDIVTANEKGNDVAVLRGDGLGGFKAPVVSAVGENPRAIASADFNGDLKRDLVIANNGGTTVSVLLGTGGGRFGGQVAYPAGGAGPRSVAVGRFNVDANDDVAVALSGTSVNKVAVLLGNGAGTLGAPTTFDVGVTPMALVIADFNGDAKADLAVANYGSGAASDVSILLGDGAGAFAPAVSVPVGIQPDDIAVGDFDTDGHLDLAVANYGSGDVSILLGDGIGGFTSGGTVTVGSKPRALAVADFNEDGWPDLAVTNEFLPGQRVAVLLGDGAGGFGAPAQFGIPGLPTALRVADTNGDGHADLAVANNDVDSVSILSGDGTGTFSSALSFSVGDQPGALAATDLTGDAKPDLAVVNFDNSNNNLWLLVNTTIFLKADLELTVDDGQVQTIPGAPITYTLTVINHGPNTVNSIRLKDEVPTTVLSPLFTPAAGSYDILTGIWSGLTLATGQSVTMTLEGTVDPLAEGSVSNTATVFPPAGVGDPNLANNTDTDTTILHTLTIGNQTVTEGATAVFTVTLSAASIQAITVNYATADGSAKAGSDYTSSSGTLTFPAGTTTRTISVATLGDALSEATETFSVVLSGASGAFVTDGGGTGTIVDDDPVPMLTITDASKAEGNSPSSMLVTVSLSTASGQTVTADYATVAGTATVGADYTTTTGTLTIPAGSLSGTISVPIVGDALNETNETFFVNLSGVTGANLADGQALCTILDDDSPPKISVDDVQVVEVGTGTTTTAAFTVSLSNPSGQVVTVHYAARDGSAVAGSDYDVTPTSGTLTFNPGDTSELVAVSVHGDAVLESTESFFLDLSTPTNATLGKGHGQAWILDQSAGQRFVFSAARYAGTEAGGKATVVVQRTGGTTGTVTVDYATSDGTAVAPGDYAATSGTLTFGPGIASRSFMVPIVNDTVVDGLAETLLVSLRNPTGGAALGSLSTAEVTITDNDLGGILAFSPASYSVGEAGAQVTLTVRRTSGTASGVTVSYATANGTATAGNDYTQTTGLLHFDAGVLAQTFTIPILDDADAEGEETFTVALSGPAGGATLGALSTATVKIVDNESALRFSAPIYTARENGRFATVLVTRSGPTDGTVTVDYATSGGSAQPGTDYTATSSTLSFAPKIMSRSFTVAIANDTVADPAETVDLHLSNPTGGAQLGSPKDATLTITDDDAGGTLQFSMASYSATEVSGLATITVKRTGGLASDVTVHYATSDGSGIANTHYTPSAGNLTFGAGATSRTFTVPILAVGPEKDRTVNLTLSSPGGGGVLGPLASAVLTIRSDDPVLEFSSAAYSVSEGARFATITVKRTGPVTQSVSVHYETSDGTAHDGVDYIGTAGSLVLPAKVVQKTFTITILNDPDVESDETVNLTLTSPVGTGGAVPVLGVRDTAVLTILADDPVVSLAAANYSVSETAKTVIITVMRSGTTTGTTTVDYATSNGSALVGLDYAAAAGTLTFAPNVKSKTVSIPILADTLSEPAETFTFTVSNPSAGARLGATTTAVVTITDNDPPGTFAFSAPDYSVSEAGPTATITVMRKAGTGGGLSVDYAATAGTAVNGQNFVATSGTLTFASGETTKTFQVLVLDDEVAGGSKTVNLSLANPGAGALGSPSTAVLWIVSR